MVELKSNVLEKQKPIPIEDIDNVEPRPYAGVFSIDDIDDVEPRYSVEGSANEFGIDPVNPVSKYGDDKTPFFEKVAKGYGTGVAGMIEGAGGVAKWFGVDGIGDSINNYADKMKKFYTVPDPDYTTAIAAGFGSMSTFLIPGMGISKGVNAMAAMPRLAAWLGVSASSVMEASVEAGNAYNKMVAKGNNHEISSLSAVSDFWLNLPVLVFTNKVGIFGEGGGAILKGIKSAAGESVQEFTQQIIGNLVTLDPLLEGALESAIVGAVVGGGTGATFGFAERADVERTKARELLDEEAIEKEEVPAEKEMLPIKLEGTDITKEQFEDEFGKPIKVDGKEAPIVIKPSEKIKAEIEKPDIVAEQKKIIADPKKTRKQKYEDISKRIDEIKQKKEDLNVQKSISKETLDYFKEEKLNYKNRIRRYAKGRESEEYNELPQYYRKAEGGITLDEAAMDAGFESDQEFRDYLIDIYEQVSNLEGDIADINKKIRVETQQKVVKSEIAGLKQRITDFKAGKLEGISEASALRKDLIKSIKKQISPEYRGRMITAIDSIKNDVTLLRAEARLDDIVQDIEDSNAMNKAISSINKELNRTKPAKRFGKYDYESNKMFEELRSLHKLTKADAMEALSITPSENLSEFDLIKQRLLSFKANGKESSLDLVKQVLADIKLLKQQGSLAKSEEDMLAKINIVEGSKEINDEINRIKKDKKNFKTDIINAYRKGASDWKSLLNSIAGKTIAEKYDVEIYEINRETGNSISEKALNKDVMELYEIKKESQLPKILHELAVKQHSIFSNSGAEYELNKFEIIDIYNSLKNDITRKRYYNAYGKEQIDDTVSLLTPKEERLADMMMEKVGSYRDVYNQEYIRKFGRDMGRRFNYWPAVSKSKITVVDDYISQSETPSALKTFINSAEIVPIPSNAWLKMQKHMRQGEHIKHVSPVHDKLVRIFDDELLTQNIKNKYGDKIYKLVLTKIDALSINKFTERLDVFSDIFSTALNNWVKAKIMLPNLTSPMRQLVSQMNFAENMNVSEWSKLYLEGIRHPKETFKFMWDNIPYLEVRYKKGSTEAISQAIKAAENMYSNSWSWFNGLTALTRFNDVAAIVYGGYPVMKSEIAKGIAAGKSEKQAIEDAAKLVITSKAQQSPMPSALSEVQQNPNVGMRALLAFKNTKFQYLRKNVDALMNYHNKDISKGQLVKVLSIYSIIQPLLYAAAGVAMSEAGFAIGRVITGRFREEQTEDTLSDLLDAVLINLAISPFGAIPLIESISNFVIRRMTGKDVYRAINVPVLTDVEVALQKAAKKNPTFQDLIEALAIVAEPLTSAPTQTILRHIKTLLGD